MRGFRVLAMEVLAALALEGVAPGTARAAGERGAGEAACSAENGDVNTDGGVNVSDAITILGHLFLGNPAELAPRCRAAAGPGGLPDTGQRVCYDDQGAIVDCASETCAGQDGDYETGCSPEGRFVDNGDGTVTDHCTGLQWQKDVGNDGNGLDWCSALAYCASLELAGHDDWRLPNLRELLSIVDYGRPDRAFDPVFGVPPAEDSFWSSTSSQVLLGWAWYVQHGSLRGFEKRSRYVVRAVRTRDAAGGQRGVDQGCTDENGDVNADGGVNISDAVTILGHLFLGEPAELAPRCAAASASPGLPDTGITTCSDGRGNVVDCGSGTCAGQDGSHETGCSPDGRFVDNRDGTVTDQCTGLMWQKVSGSGNRQVDWCSALTYCESLELAGYDDWRLPDVLELQSIVDYTRTEPSIDPVFRVPSMLWEHWSSSNDADDPSRAWKVAFSDGYVVSSGKAFVNSVRAVRNVR